MAGLVFVSLLVFLESLFIMAWHGIVFSFHHRLPSGDARVYLNYKNEREGERERMRI